MLFFRNLEIDYFVSIMFSFQIKLKTEQRNVIFEKN